MNAADPLVAEMAPKCPGTVIFFARDPKNPVLAAHRACGRRGVFVRNDAVVLAEGDKETVLVSLTRVPLTHQGRIDFQVENVLAASAAAWSLGLPLQAIADVLEVFTSDIQQTPGRFNVLYHGEATIVLDYGHNSSALLALVDAIAVFPHKRRLTVLHRGRRSPQRRHHPPGRDHRRPLRLHHPLRGRLPPRPARRRGDRPAPPGPGSRPAALGQLRDPGRAGGRRAALGRLRPGDLLYIQPDQVELCLGFVQNYLATHPPIVGRDRVAEESGLIIAV